MPEVVSFWVCMIPKKSIDLDFGICKWCESSHFFDVFFKVFGLLVRKSV